MPSLCVAYDDGTASRLNELELCVYKLNETTKEQVLIIEKLKGCVEKLEAHIEEIEFRSPGVGGQLYEESKQSFEGRQKIIKKQKVSSHKPGFAELLGLPPLS